MQQRRGDEVAFLGMAGLDDPGPMTDFVDRHGLDGFPHAVDGDGSLWLGFGVTTQSVFVFLNDDGTFETTSYGVLGEDTLEERVDDLLSR